MESKQLKHTAEQVDETIDRISRFKIRKQGKSHGNKIIVGRLPKLSPHTVGNKYLVTRDYAGSGHLRTFIAFKLVNEEEREDKSILLEVNGRLINEYQRESVDNGLGKLSIIDWEEPVSEITGVDNKALIKVTLAAIGGYQPPLVVKVVSYGYESEPDALVYKLKIADARGLLTNETSSPNLTIRYGQIVSMEPPEELSHRLAVRTRKNLHIHKYKTYFRRKKWVAHDGHKFCRIYGICRKYAKKPYISNKKNPHKMLYTGKDKREMEFSSNQVYIHQEKLCGYKR